MLIYTDGLLEKNLILTIISISGRQCAVFSTQDVCVSLWSLMFVHCVFVCSGPHRCGQSANRQFEFLILWHKLRMLIGFLVSIPAPHLPPDWRRPKVRSRLVSRSFLRETDRNLHVTAVCFQTQTFSFIITVFILINTSYICLLWWKCTSVEWF